MNLEEEISTETNHIEELEPEIGSDAGSKAEVTHLKKVLKEVKANLALEKERRLEVQARAIDIEKKAKD